MTVPSVESKAERIVDDFFEALLSIKNDSTGAYWVRPKRVERQPIPFDACKVYPTYFAVDGDRTISGKPGGDLLVEFPVVVWVYAKDAENVSRLRNRIIRDIVSALHGDRSRGNLTYDSRVGLVRHDQGVFAPLTWIVIEFNVRYRSTLAEV